MTEQQEDMPSTGRGTRRRLWAGIVATVLVAAGVTTFWWKPWQSVVLPQSACWSALGPDDLRPLVGTNGTAVAYSGGGLETPMTAADPDMKDWCTVRWAGGPVLDVNVNTTPNGISKAEDQARGWRTLDFGPDAQGRFEDPNDILVVVLRCDYPLPADKADEPADPYVLINIDGDPKESQYSRTRVRQAYADIALKIARTAVTQYPCTNSVHLADKAPTVPPTTES
ncbi:hypothetical protein P3T37_001188 [Kitasatospora sp. MAA4]|uniref:hypothetical protein n=1 Tax=Kitasatospora sp. MAA4 TaxID=3035093 RepID=UPI0024765EDE|nr:hypothetical protein [Kitasatospora sp. MAA4]MDH6131814.1 hypothetical protein [Kitasatospora sp. MAA4]